MEVYQTDIEGFFVGITLADPNPLEPGEWIIPGGCVEIAPPILETGQRAKWQNNQWIVVNPEPEPEPEPALDISADEQIRMQRNALLIQSDWTQVADAPVDRSAWALYRQALRDVPQQDNFPADVIWPEKPQ